MGSKIILVLVAYLLGNFSTSFFVGKIFANIDIREHGSGNAGSTNVLRTLGIKAAALTFLCDLLKGVLAIYVGRKFGGESMALMCGVAVVIGHNWPVLLKFKGGKGIATTIGAVLMLKPLVAFICVSIGVGILFKYKYVSLASITAVSLLPVVISIFGMNYFIFGLILAFLGVYRHHQNIKRLLAGTENKIKSKKKESLE